MNFEWRAADKMTGWLWIPLLVLVAAPFPAFSSPLPERALPIFWLIMAGGACLLARLARASWPLAALMGWALLRCLWTGFQIDAMSLKANVVVMDASRVRPLQMLILLAFVALLYVTAREMPARVARYAAWALVAGVGYEVAFGYLNLWGVYPFMTYIVPDQMGRPMGFLTHPNYWGSFVALGLPLVWALGGIVPTLFGFGVIVASYSGGPVISAAAGLGFLAWPQLSRRMRYAAVATLSVVVTIVMTVHEWRLSGRREVWQAIWPELMRYPIIGQGLGSWRIWADHFNAKLSATTGKYEAFATLQAHNEPYQLWFELGLIGLFFAALFCLQIGLAAMVTCAATKPAAWSTARTIAWWKPGRVPLERAWVAMLLVGAVNMLGSPTLHLPGQAAFLVLALGRVQAFAAATLMIDTIAQRAAALPGRRPRASSRDRLRAAA